MKNIYFICDAYYHSSFTDSKATICQSSDEYKRYNLNNKVVNSVSKKMFFNLFQKKFIFGKKNYRFWKQPSCFWTKNSRFLKTIVFIKMISDNFL